LIGIQSKPKLRHVTPSAPCPICKKPDWCSVSNNGEVVICMRVGDGARKATRNGGWLHLTTDPTAPRRPYVAPIRITAPAFRRHQVYTTLLENLELSPQHSAHLLDVRHLSEETITRIQFSTVPSEKRAAGITAELARAFDLESVPGFFREDGEWKLRFTGGNGFYIPLRDVQGRISALQIRLDYGDRRYLLLSSTDMPGGASSGVPAHFARPWLVKEALLITEGGLKAEVVSEQLEAPVCGLVAVGTFTDRFGWQLRTCFPDLTRVAVAYDQEVKPKSKEATEKQKARLIRSLESAQLAVESWEWPASEGKGYDDYLINRRAA
jgi:DNA primase